MFNDVKYSHVFIHNKIILLFFLLLLIVVILIIYCYLKVCRLAAEWRQTFLRDCVVDIVCYRRHGHNSLDDPSITQPLIYNIIKTHPTVLEKYSKQLIDSNVITNQILTEKKNTLWDSYEKDYASSKSYEADPLEWLASNWQVPYNIGIACYSNEMLF